MNTTPHTNPTPNTSAAPSGAPDAGAAPNGGPSKSPSHAVYHVRDVGNGQAKKSFWTRVGSAWPHADGKGFNVQVECVPLDGRLTLRVAGEDKE